MQALGQESAYRRAHAARGRAPRARRHELRPKTHPSLLESEQAHREPVSEVEHCEVRHDRTLEERWFLVF